MPATRATIRGNPGPIVTRTGFYYNPETGITTQEIEYSGSELGISGLTRSFAARNREHRGDYEGGVSRATVSTPVQSALILDKYEILWEMEQRSIFNHPAVKQAAMDFDTALDDLPEGETGDTFRKKAEDSRDGKIDEVAAADPVSGAMFLRVVALLRAGVDTWEQEYVVLRRTRVLPPDEISPMNVDAASLIYTTAQLFLPNDVLFILPDIASLVEPDPLNFLWGWRRRPSTNIIQGQAAEQTSEFILAAWNLVTYSPATTNADW